MINNAGQQSRGRHRQSMPTLAEVAGQELIWVQPVVSNRTMNCARPEQ